MGCNIMMFRDSPTFCRNRSPPSSGLKSKLSQTCRLLLPVYGLTYSSDLKLEVVCSSDTLGTL
jgi:hypothetical protein